MDSNLIPKSLTRERLVIVKNITFYDLGLAVIYFLVAVLTAVGLVFISPLYRVITGLTIFFFLSATLLTNKHYHLKNYQVLILAFKFWAKKKNYASKSLTLNTTLLVPYHRIVNDTVIETDKLDGGLKWFVSAIEIKGFNISALSNEEQLLKISEIKEVFKFLDCQLSLVKIDQPINITENINHLKLVKKQLLQLHKTKKLTQLALKSRLTQLQGYIDNFQNEKGIININATNKRFYLFIYHQKLSELEKYVQLAEQKIVNSSLQAIICNKYQIINTIKAIFNPFEVNFSNKVIDENCNNLKALLSFEQVSFMKDHFKINDVFYAINAIHNYPVFPKNGWGASLASDNATMIWNISNPDRDSIKDLVHKAIGNATTNILSVKKVVDKSEQWYQMQAFQNLVDALTSGEEVIKKCNVMFLSYGTSLKNLKANQNQLQLTLKENNMIIDNLIFRQTEGFSAILPKPTDPLAHWFAREMPCWTLASSFPFINNALDDNKGLFMGFNTTNDLVVFDQFKQDYHRKNFNQLLLGTSGSGKSHTGKKQLNWHISNGRKVIVIDPEREYQALCHYHHGNWIDVGNASAGHINPLQILSSLDENETNQMIIANYLQTLEHWFSIIIPDLDANELRYLMQKVNELYESKNLTVNAQLGGLKPEAFPVFSDLLNFMQSQNLSSKTHQKIINIIALEFTGSGKYAQLYNHHSTLQLNENLLTVFDINSLFEKGNNKVIQAQLFLILAYIQHEVKNNSFYDTNEIIILVDEAHLIIDKDNPAGLNFMFQMVKRIRKRRGGIILITQNPDDFVGTPEIKKKTTAMMNNTQYTMVLNLSPQNLTDVMELFKAYGGLSNQERDFIAKAKRGQALFVVSGFNRHCVQIELSATELAAFTNETKQQKGKIIMAKKAKQLKIQFAISPNLYHQLKTSNVTGNIDDSFATKIRALINEYT